MKKAKYQKRYKNKEKRTKNKPKQRQKLHSKNN